MDRRERLAREWFRTLSDREFDRLGDLLTEDASMELVHWDQRKVNDHTTVKYDNPLVGRDAIVQLYTRSADIFTYLTFEIDAVHLIEGGNTAVLEYRCDGLAKSTGNPYRNTYCAIFAFAGERVSLWREYHDPSEFDRAFGNPET